MTLTRREERETQTLRNSESYVVELCECEQVRGIIYSTKWVGENEGR